MALTYLELVNTLLVRNNEVPLSASDFAGARGVKAAAKEYIQTAIDRINSEEWTWPFNAVEVTGALLDSVGETRVYSFPADFKVADWTSFQLERNDTLGAQQAYLNHLDYTEYMQSYQINDLNGSADTPARVFRNFDDKWGISPVPDKDYTIRYVYYQTPSRLTAAEDTTRIPDAHKTVILDMAAHYMYLFKSNGEAASKAHSAYKVGIASMRSLLLNRYDRLRDTRVNVNATTSQSQF